MEPIHNAWKAGTEPAAIQARGLTFLRGRRVVFRDVDLDVAPGEIVVLTGSNGAGKTTLLQCLTGALRPAAGKILYLSRATARGADVRRWIGFLGHETGLYLALTVWENLLFAAHLYGVSNAERRSAELLASVGLEKQTRQRAGALSRGMRQRLAIARTVLHDPTILLLDEPFTSLDGEGRAWLVAFLRVLRQHNRAVVLATHDTEQGCELADRVLGLRGGRLYPIEHFPDETSIPRAA